MLDERGWPPGADALDPARLAGLYRQLHRLFPPAKDPPPPAEAAAWTVVTRGHRAAELRDELLDRLARHGTWQAVEQLGQLREADPRGGLLDRHYRRAVWAACQRSWQPLTPAELAEFIHASHPRVVHDSGQLLELVTATLQELQHDLLVDSSLVNQLWDAQYAAGDWRRPICWRPKDEAALADLAAWFLRMRLGGHGVVVGREVQVRRLRGHPQGERADIQVDLGPPGPDPAAAGPRVVVEVKGCWHRDVASSLGDQLVGRYLAGQPGAAGCYLVGWYDPAAVTTPDDPRHVRAPWASLAEARRCLDAQARQVAGPWPTAAVVLDARLHPGSRPTGDR
jgi:hypothetical protein